VLKSVKIEENDSFLSADLFIYSFGKFEIKFALRVL